MSKKFVYMFADTDSSMRNLLGGKGANLGEMTRLGLPIPQGFTITTEACTQYYHDGRKISSQIEKEILKSVKELEKITEKEFGNPEKPLLVSVRSGARVSMPGMMDTVLNLGLNDKIVDGIIAKTGNARFARDSYRRFIQMFSDVVIGLEKSKFERIIDQMKEEKHIKLDTEFTADDFAEMVVRFKKLYKQDHGQDFPDSPIEQLIAAVGAVFRSWDNPRADYYRKMNTIPWEWGTAVNVQSMVYGNMGETSGTGVAFTRNPATGEKKVFGEFLMNAQGEDVVAGIRTPNPLADLEKILPKAHKQFMELSTKLENHYHDMQDIEFTIEEEKLYFLQTRNGKRTAPAALKIAVDLFHEGLLTKEEAVMKVEPLQLENLLHPHFDNSMLKETKPIGKGLPASPGAATGMVVFNVEEVLEYKKAGKPTILVRLETSPEDIEGMHVAEGFLTARGGMTSHAAVVARGMGKTCVSGCHELTIDEEKGFYEIDGVRVNRGDYMAIDGNTGLIYNKQIKTVPAEITGEFKEFMGWVDEIRQLGVRTNAETVADAKQAVLFGAEGIGLVRTEHMFFEASRIKAIREFIVSQDVDQRKKALEKILPMQQKDFEDLLVALEARPMTVRYMDPPLHEFLPTQEKDIVELAKELNITKQELDHVIQSLHEFNPMMGHRGCRLAVSYPELAEMQTVALMSAYIKLYNEKPEWREKLVPEIMIPLVGEVKELKFVKNIVVQTIERLLKEANVKMEYHVGTMIEVPRAALLADEIAKEADFFSFGTNDLTQLTFGFSRDDAATFLKHYYDTRIYEFDPFQTVDVNGVGKLIQTAVKLGRKSKKNLKVGVCGEHGGEAISVDFFHNVGLDYVSCSPFRVPIARLAAAQAAVRNKR